MLYQDEKDEILLAIAERIALKTQQKDARSISILNSAYKEIKEDMALSGTRIMKPPFPFEERPYLLEAYRDLGIPGSVGFPGGTHWSSILADLSEPPPRISEPPHILFYKRQR